MTAKEKRERGLELERILAGLPLEFRGDDPNLRRHIEAVIEKFLDNPGEGFSSMSFHPVCCTRACSNRAFYTVVAFVKPPDLNQARVNKCLIALVNRKIVRKDNRTVSDHICSHALVLTRPSGSCFVLLERTSSIIPLYPYRRCIWYPPLLVTVLKRRACIELTAIFLQFAGLAAGVYLNVLTVDPLTGDMRTIGSNQLASFTCPRSTSRGSCFVATQSSQ